MSELGGAKGPKRKRNRWVEDVVPVLAPFPVAGRYLGATGRALWMRFHRDIYPERFKVQLTNDTPGVRLRDLIAWIEEGRPAVGPTPPSTG